MRDERAQRLAELAQRRSDEARFRVREAVRRLDRAGQPVTFAAVAEAASVSRSWLYRVDELRSEIERLRRQPPAAASRLPAAQRSTVESYQRRIEALLDANRELRAENRRLNDRLAELLGAGRDPRRRHVIDGDDLAPRGPRPTRSR